MYKILLCWRYLLTRYLALACIISVMLGVATLIVVNAVMGGFSNKLKERLHGLLSDVVIETPSLDGFPDPEGKMEMIRNDPVLKDKIVAMAPTMEVFAMLQFNWRGQSITRPVRLIGIDPESRSKVGGFSKHLMKQKDVAVPSFKLSEMALERYHWRHPLTKPKKEIPMVSPGDGPPPPMPPDSKVKVPRGIILGNLLASFRQKNKKGETEEKYLLQPGDDVIITTVSGGKLKPVYDNFVVVDFFKSEMSEYDSNYVFVPLDYLQRLRAMDNRVTSIQIRLKNYQRDKKVVKERLAELFPEFAGFRVDTWEGRQGPLLAAISIERGILNVLLFLIIGVAGFGILAIFSMIVAEKTRDIGIMKALGASNRGVLTIFLGYGFLLGVVGAGLGTLLGVTLTDHINDVEKILSWATGQDVFDRTIYYFTEIPTLISAWDIFLLNFGAVSIAVLFSVLPAMRAAMLHPVRALRYE